MNLDPYDLNAFIAPKYDGLSHKTTSPSFKNTLPAKSNPEELEFQIPLILF